MPQYGSPVQFQWNYTGGGLLFSKIVPNDNDADDDDDDDGDGDGYDDADAEDDADDADCGGDPHLHYLTQTLAS